MPTNIKKFLKTNKLISYSGLYYEGKGISGCYLRMPKIIKHVKDICNSDIIPATFNLVGTDLSDTLANTEIIRKGVFVSKEDLGNSLPFSIAPCKLYDKKGKAIYCFACYPVAKMISASVDFLSTVDIKKYFNVDKGSKEILSYEIEDSAYSPKID